MSSGEVGPLGAARAANPFEPAIESNDCSSKDKQSSSNGHEFTIGGATIAKTTPGGLFDSVGDGLDAAAGLASDPVVIASEQDNLYDKELHAKSNEEQGNVSTIAIEDNQETIIDAKEYGSISLPKSILKNHPTTEPTFNTSNEAVSEVKGQSYEDIMSSAYTSPTPSQLPMTPPLHKSLDVLSTIHEYEPLADNTEPLEDTLTASSASQGVPPTAHSTMPPPHEEEVTPRDGPPSEQMQEGHAVEIGSQPEVAAEVASGNGDLNGPISVSAAEPSSSADSPSAGGGDNGLLQESDIEMDAQVTNENSVALAKQAKKNGHGECDDKAKPEATVAERTERSPDTNQAPFLDETTTHTNETAIILSSPSAERLRPSEAGGTEVGKEAPEYATVAHGDVVVLEAVPASGHDSAKDAYGIKDPAKTEEPADVTPTLVPNETTGHSESDVPHSIQQELSEGPYESLTAVTMAGSAKVGSTGDPSTGDQDPALPLSAETTVAATSNNATGELKEEALPTLVDVENLTFSPQCQESAVKEPGQAAPSKQEGWTTNAVPVHEEQAQTATDTHTQDLAPAGPADGIPAQSVGLSPTAPDPQVSTKDPVVPSLPLVDRPEATNDQLFLVDTSTAASPPEETTVNVQTEAEAAQTSEDRQTGGPDLVEEEIPPTGIDQSDAPGPTPKAEESAQEPPIGLHQDQQLTESANEPAQPCDPAPIVGEPNESQIDAFFQEPQTHYLLEDSKADGGFSPGSPLFESGVAAVNNLGVKEHSGAPLVEEPQERAYIEGARGYDPTAIVNEPNIEPHGVSVDGSMPALGGATQGDHDVTCGIQLESLDALANKHTESVNAPIGSPAALNDQMDGLNLEWYYEIFEQPKTVDAVSEAPDFLAVGGIEHSAVEPPKGVEAYDQDKRPEMDIDDSGAAGQPQTEMAQEYPIESIAPAQAERQDTPANSIRNDISSEEVTPTNHSTILPTEDIAHVATVEYAAEEPIYSFDQDGKPEGPPKPTSNESAVQGIVNIAPETREPIVGPVSQATPAEPDKIVTKPAGPVEFKDRKSAETSKDESPATNGEDSIAETFKEVEELPGVNPTSTSVMDPALPAFEGLASGEELQEPGGNATPASDGPSIRSEQDKAALGTLQFIGCSPKSPAGVIGVPDDHNAYFDEFSLRGELLQPASPKLVEREAPQNGVLDQQSEVVKDGGEVKAILSTADRLDGSCPPEESVSYPALPPLDESKASAPTELTGKGHGGPFEFMSVIQSGGQRSQAPETSAMLGPEEPALHHIDPPAEFTIEKGKYQPVPEEATQKERSTTPYETPDTMGSYISRPPYEPSATTEHEVDLQPSTGGLVVHGASVPVLSGDHTLLDQSTPSVPLTVTTRIAIPDTVQGNALAELTMFGDQGEGGNAPNGRDTMPGGDIASKSPCGQSAEPSHEVEATIASVQDVKLIDEPIPSGDELLSEINTDVVVAEDDVDHTWVADDGETATTVVLPDPPSTDPARSGSETIALAKLDTKLPHSETTLETLYISLLSPEEVHEQQISYLVGELPKVAVMVPPAGPQTANQEIEIQIQEEKEAEQAAEKIEAERDEIERSVSYNVVPNAVEEARTVPVAFEDASPLPGESVAQEMGASQSTEILDKPPNLAVQEQATQDAGIEQLAGKAASEVSIDDTISDEPAPTETSDGEPIAIATEASEFEDTQEILRPSAPAHGETDLSLSLADAPLVADSTPLPTVVTCPPPTEAAITTLFLNDEDELREQGPSDVDITPGADGNKPPVAVAKDLEPSPSAEPIIEGLEVVENATSSKGVVVERTKGVVEELAVKEEAEKAAGEAVEKARIEQEAREAEKENECQPQLKLDEEHETESVKVDEVERAELETLELQRQAALVEKQKLVEEEAQKLRDTLIAKLEAEAARLEAEFKEHEQARLLAMEKEIEEASDCPIAPSTPRSELSSITSGFDSPSQISLASHMATAPDSPRIAPEDPTPFVELPESDLILQNRSPKSINSSIAGEPPETPLGSLPNSSLLANDLTPPARTFSRTGRPASFKLGSPLHISTENVAGNNSTDNATGSHSKYDPPPVLVPKLSITPASTANLYFTSRPEVVLPELSDMVFPFTGGVEDLPPVVEDEDADMPPRPVPRTRHLSTISNFSISHRMPGGWTHSTTVAEGRTSLDVAEGEFSPVPRTPRPSAVEPESDGERGSRCVIM